VKSQKTVELFVGLFLLIAIFSLVFLAFRVSGLTPSFSEAGFKVTASFENIGGLKVRAPVAMAGVKVGEVSSIRLDSSTYQAIVTILLFQHKVPDDSSASILTEGLLGSNYIGLTPGFSTKFLSSGSKIETTHPALILEKLIGQFLFNINKKSS
jgi:phospholipid/cholesterol/gamma-HCH transport system substrate-binding protein